MKYIVLIFSFFLINISDSYSHGPSRQKVVKKIELNAPSEKVWELISNFGDYGWHPDVLDSKSNGKEVGAVREINLKDEKKISQSLEKLKPEKKIVSWRIVKTDLDILPVNSYSATLIINQNEKDSNKCTLTFKAAFYRGFMGNDPPENLNDENSKKKVILFVEKSLKGIKNIVEK
tara:strand:- start:193 stop:720 length:528 start_codon:yes stop_codon:yes gene_type:complete